MRRRAIWNVLPLEARADRWGDESYVAVPVELSADEAREVVGEGDVAYWPPRQAVCILGCRTAKSQSSSGSALIG